MSPLLYSTLGSDKLWKNIREKESKPGMQESCDREAAFLALAYPKTDAQGDPVLLSNRTLFLDRYLYMSTIGYGGFSSIVKCVCWGN